MIDQYMLSNAYVWSLWALAETLVFYAFLHGLSLCSENRFKNGVLLVALFSMEVGVHLCHFDMLGDYVLKICISTGYLLLSRDVHVKKAMFLCCMFYLIADFSRLLVMEGIMQRILYSTLIAMTPWAVSTIHIALVCAFDLAISQAVRSLVMGNAIDDYTLGQLVIIAFPVMTYIAARYMQFTFKGIYSTLDTYILCIVLLLAACCILAVIGTDYQFSAQIKKIKAFNREMLVKQEQLYVQKKDMLDALREVRHDLRHFITGMESLSNMEEVQQYVSQIKNRIAPYDILQETGSPILDVILAEKMDFCRGHGVTLIANVDGTAFSFVSSLDLCTIFGNALENAIEAVLPIEDASLREIRVKVRRMNKIAVCSFNNCYQGSLRISGGRLQSCKADSDSHGYGVENIRRAVEKYGGTTAYEIENDEFTLNILIPE